MSSFFKNPFYQFLIKALLLYLGYYLVYELWLRPQRWLDMLVISNLETASSLILTSLGFSLIQESSDVFIRTIGIDGTNGLWIGDPCDGLTLFALFAGFVIAYPGPIKTKLWFIPLGLTLIHLLNILRIVALVVIVYYFPDPEVLDFNHTYTFTMLVYAFVFGLWYIWANKLGGIKAHETVSGS